MLSVEAAIVNHFDEGAPPSFTSRHRQPIKASATTVNCKVLATQMALAS